MADPGFPDWERVATPKKYSGAPPGGLGNLSLELPAVYVNVSGRTTKCLFSSIFKNVIKNNAILFEFPDKLFPISSNYSISFDNI